MKVRYEGAVKDIYGNILIHNIRRETFGPTMEKCKSQINYRIKTQDCKLLRTAKIVLDGKWIVIE